MANTIASAAAAKLTPATGTMIKNNAMDSSFEIGVIPPAQRRCLNCKTPMSGPYCFQCGQHEKSSLRHVGLLVRDILDDVLNLDSRAVRTLKPLLFRPGFLTKEYLSGKRMRFVPPLRLYVIASLLFFLVAGTAVKNWDNAVNFDDPTPEQAFTELQAELTEENHPLANDPEVLALQALIAEHSNRRQEAKNIPSKEEQKIMEDRIAALALRVAGDKIGTALSPKVKADDDRRAPHFDADQKASMDIKPALNAQTKATIPKATTPTTPTTLTKPTTPTTPTTETSTAKKTATKIVQKNNAFHIGPSDEKPDEFLDFETSTLTSYPWLKPITEKVNQNWQKIRKDPASAKPIVFSVLPQSMFVLLPLFALLLKFFYAFSSRLYVEHLIVAVHSHCFLFFGLTSLILLSQIETYVNASWAQLPLLPTLLSIGLGAASVWLPVYLWLMQKHVYGQSWLMTSIKFLWIGLAYIILLALTGLSAFVIGLLNA